MATTPGPTVFVLFGATGDLAKRMVLPAFYTLAVEGLLPDDWVLVGNGRGDVSHEDFQGHVHDVLTEFGPAPDQGPWREFRRRLRFAGGGFATDDPGSLLDVIGQARDELPADAQLVHYLAVPPVAFGEITRALGEHGLADRARVVYEKPFGTSPENFRELDRLVHSVLDESQVYRIDHFLGKEATQNLHVLRFANEMFGAVWNRRHIESVQIDVPETLGVDDRAEFYDATGAVLDMLVTHLFQVAAEVAMEPPASLGADDLRAAREKVIRAFRPLDPAEVVLGQFAGYRDVPGVGRRSRTDTYVAARLWIDNPRWRGVPFLLRTGKRLAADEQRVSLVLRTPDHPFAGLAAQSNVLSFALSGSGEIDLGLLAKKPGVELSLRPASVRLPLADLPDAEPLPPYVRLLHDVLVGDRSLFTRPDGLAAVWKVAAPLLADRPRMAPYPPGSWGPARAGKLAAPHRWLLGQ
ncbi:glucose-6-phosphate dehydrogenase [Jidongwangia harbinensis]|uniref:glucose-6-phosphate dehydrogenase n=1 Tax=Jidongwangia harbinensis TaxID=2878561 RepID=UPI001CD9BE7C|nr:glucose-6-phosphate dehydrogenase (NADP(+)) [Jidongwangia harbinensis]MCA2216236.1 glucose-6-phosphate dehydrogenase (NADP(+)) [Jidongwangia harbinensis]